MGSNVARPITNGTSPGSIRFEWYKSGAYSTLNLCQTTTIIPYAPLSLYKANINMYKSSIIGTEQHFGSAGANLYCETNETCTIQCREYGCANISSATGNGTYIVDCGNNFVLNILCNTSNNVTQFAPKMDFKNDDNIPSILIEYLYTPRRNNIEDDLNWQKYNIYFMYKNFSKHGINCGDYGECYNRTLNYTNKAICCTSCGACWDGNAFLTIDINSTLNGFDYGYGHDYDYPIAIDCSDGYSCGDATNGAYRYVGDSKFAINKIN